MRTKLLLKSIVLISMIMLLPQRLVAYDFKVAGVCYNITGENTVEVTSSGTHPNYCDVEHINIPAQVSFNGKVYKVTAIGYYGLCGAFDVKSVTLPEGLVSIGECALNSLHSIKELTLPSTVESVRGWAFEHLDNARYIKCLASEPPRIDGYWFHNAGYLPTCPFYVPDGSLDSYQSSAYWRAFNLQEMEDYPVGETKEFTVNGAAFTMVKVDGGLFTMGATDEQGHDYSTDEIPLHNVTLDTYWIGQTEVTEALWENVMGSNPSYSKKGDNYPVENITWNDCQTFVNKLSELTDETFRLPTEAEWEYAARGGNKSKYFKYSGSNNVDEVSWNEFNSGGAKHPVARKFPNELGLYDMSGNVWERCQDIYGPYSSAEQTNPTGSSSGSKYSTRGGGWYDWGDSDDYSRVSNRGGNPATDAHKDMGLRLVYIPKPIIEISLDQHNVKIPVGESVTLAPKSNIEGVDYTVNVLDPSVATYQWNGTKIEINGVAAGETSIVVSASGDNVVPDTCQITVLSGSDIFIVNGLRYIRNYDNTATLTYSDNSNLYANNYTGLTSAIIPDKVTYNGRTYTVTEIGDDALYNCTALSEVVIPSTVEKIGRRAFYKCKALKSIYIPASVEILMSGAFSSCTNLESIIVDENNPVYDSRNNCNAIIETHTNTLISGSKNSLIPNTVTAIGNDSFSGFSSITAIEIPSSVKNIGAGAFYACGLEEINIPGSVKTIERNAFRLCAKLTDITLPNSVILIGNGAFSYCRSVKSITLGRNIQSIGNDAFDYTKALEQIRCRMMDPTTIVYGTNIFNNIEPAECSLTIPTGTLELYQAQEPWSSFINFFLRSNADITGEGIVNVGDVSALYRVILSSEQNDDGDVNGDGRINAGDISEIYKIMLNNE